MLEAASSSTHKSDDFTQIWCARTHVTTMQYLLILLAWRGIGDRCRGRGALLSLPWCLPFRLGMHSYNSVTSHFSTRRVVVLLTLIAVVLVGLFGMSVSAAQDAATDVEVTDPPVTVASLDGPSSEVAELVLQLEERDQRIKALHEQLAFLQQAALSSEQQIDVHRDTFFDEQREVRFGEPFQERAMSEWRIGYVLGGGQNLRSFESIILPCESGGEPDPDEAVSSTDDWGRAQINRPTWSKRFTELTGARFEDQINHPILNGFMAAHVESEQGLNAWTCWRKR